MFVRIVKAKGKEYLVIVESYWKDKKVKHRTIASLGNLEELRKKGKIERLAMGLVRFCKEGRHLFDITKAKEEDRKKWGIVRVVRKLWEMFEMDD